MQILNPKLEGDLQRGAIKLELGSGQNRREGFYALDHLELDGVDIVADLNQPLELLPNDCCEIVYSHHVLEHVNEILGLMREIHRITRPGGLVEIVVPHFSNVYGYSDPTHVRLFGLYSMYYFVAIKNQPPLRQVPEFYTNARFLMRSIKIEFYRSGVIDRVLFPFLNRFVNASFRNQDFYERRLAHLFHAWQIRYVMSPDKP